MGTSVKARFLRFEIVGLSNFAHAGKWIREFPPDHSIAIEWAAWRMLLPFGAQLAEKATVSGHFA